MEQKKQLLKLINQAKKILIVPHMGPDGDAIGSTLATKEWLEQNFETKSVAAMVTGVPNDSWKNWKGIEQLQWVSDIAYELRNFDLVIFVDVGEKHRVSNNTGDLSLEKIKSVIIDHHEGDLMGADLIISYPDAISTTQILADKLFSDAEINDEIAKNLLLGIIFDSGSFSWVQHKNSDSLLTTKRLVDYLKLDQIDTLLLPFQNFDKEELEVMKALFNNVRQMDSIKATVSYLDEAAHNSDKVKVGRSRFLKPFLRNVEGYPWGFVITKKSRSNINAHEYGLSFRSIVNIVNVAKLSAELFEGGGHQESAGGVYFSKSADKEVVIAEIVVLIENYLRQTKEI